MIINLEEKTGKKLSHWTDVVNKSSLTKHSDLVNLLKKEHGLGHGYANMVVHLAKESSSLHLDGDTLVDAQYKGKEPLLPIFKKLKEVIQKFGEDVEVSPKKSAVSFRRKRQFALVQPSTKTRVDLGLKFNAKPHAGRLETSGPFGTMCTHRVKLVSVDEVDAELVKWLKEAYEEAK